VGWGLSEGSAAGFPGAVRETVITVNHEINNPLTTILGAAQVLLLSQKEELSDRTRDRLKMIDLGLNE